MLLTKQKKTYINALKTFKHVSCIDKTKMQNKVELFIRLLHSEMMKAKMPVNQTNFQTL